MLAARAPAKLPEQLIIVIKESPAIATTFICHGDESLSDSTATLRFSAKIMAVRAMLQGFPMPIHTQENRNPKNSE